MSPIPSLLDLAVVALCSTTSLWLYYRRPQISRRAYFVENIVTHARLLPVESQHAFTYPAIALLLSVNDLESGKLNTGLSWLFGYGGGPRLLSLRPQPYLTPDDDLSILEKLDHLLQKRGYPGAVENVWMLTMPRILGFEGTNPLTVYWCYKPDGEPWLTVLEIHNTFGETHVHVLQAGKNEDQCIPNGFDNSWTFRREFHVSPFNDRLGHYVVSTIDPFSSTSFKEPRVAVRVHQHAEPTSDDVIGPLKLTALLRSKRTIPLTASNIITILARYPLALFLTLARVLYHAWILHYVKRLDVFARPEPLPASSYWIGKSGKVSLAGGTKWLPAGAIETYARRKVESFLSRRAQELQTKVILVGPDSRQPPTVYETTSDPRNFTILLASPSAEHALLVGCDAEGLFVPSSRELFLRVFSPSHSPSVSLSRNQTRRIRNFPPSLTKIPIPSSHFLGVDGDSWTVWAILLVLDVLDGLEKRVFQLARARMVLGTEPWRKWERAAAIHEGNFGSVRREIVDQVI
ncbi:hypothetical protein DL96DRAFT_1571857 [Flagelloscypha sp. PMI_526]|nr:hypothetical protein DL96DRAFT_1571857 [Flagelloscypha sp. PMI_526]